MPWTSSWPSPKPSEQKILLEKFTPSKWSGPSIMAQMAMNGGLWQRFTSYGFAFGNRAHWDGENQEKVIFDSNARKDIQKKCRMVKKQVERSLNLNQLAHYSSYVSKIKFLGRHSTIFEKLHRCLQKVFWVLILRRGVVFLLWYEGEEVEDYFTMLVF